MNQEISTLTNRIIQQEILIQALCDVLLDNDIIDESTLMDRVNINIEKVNKQFEDLQKKSKPTKEKTDKVTFFGQGGTA